MTSVARHGSAALGTTALRGCPLASGGAIGSLLTRPAALRPKLTRSALRASSTRGISSAL